MKKRDIAKALLSIQAVFLRPEDPFYMGKRNKKSHLLRQQAHIDRAKGQNADRRGSGRSHK